MVFFSSLCFPVTIPMDMTRREILRLYVKLDSQYDMLIKHNEELKEENTQLKKTIEELDLSKNY